MAEETKIDEQAPAVEMTNLSLAFGDKTVLKDVNLIVNRGERVVVMGQSGGGKSTLLRLIMGILKPSAGTIKVFGKDISQVGRNGINAIRRRISLVYQYSALISSLSVQENLALPLLELTDMPKREIDAIIDEKLGLVGMEDTKDKLPSELSGGMRKRIALARALVISPDMILFDEPSAGLDPVISSVIDELIINLTEKTGSTALIVTHEMDSAFRIATRMAMLMKGEIIADETPDKFRNSQNPYVKQFVTGSTEGPITKEMKKHASSS